MTTMTRPHPLDQHEHQLVVIGGVDTHRDEHVAAVIDTGGRLLAVSSFTAEAAGYAALLAWLQGHGDVVMIGVEGTGSYGLGLARYLALASDAELVEIDRPDRRARFVRGKSDALDAENAARTAWSRRRTGIPKTRHGRRGEQVEAVRNLRVARRSAVEQRADTLRQIKSLIITAPDELRARLSGLPVGALLRTCAGLRPDPTRTSRGDALHATKTALRALARRHTTLSEEITDLDALISPLVEAINPRLVALNGLGPDTAAQLLITAGANPERLRTEAAFAMLCGVAPVPASSGRTHRMRLNRGGDRQANAAIYRILLTRMRWDPTTHAYLQRRTTEGKTKKEAMRCLKRYIAREIYQALTHPHPHTT